MTTLTRLSLSGGVWEGLLADVTAAPRLCLRHRDEVVAEPEVAPCETGFRVRFTLPVERLGDGAQTFILENAETGEALASETLVAGSDAGMDLRGEVELLRAELDMLKRAFRRHCAED